MANLFLSDSIAAMEDFFVGDPIAQANKVISEKLQQSLEFAFNKTPTNAIGNLVVTSTSVQYTLAPSSVAPAGVKIVINGSGFPSGTTTLSSLGADTDYSISSVTVIVDSVAGTNFANPVSTATLNTNISVVASRMKTFGLNGFTIAAGDVNVALTGTLTTALGTDSSGNVTLKTASFSNAGLSITYDTDPSSTATKLAQLYLKGSFGLDSANMSDPLTSATITDFGFKTFAGTNVTASPVHYFYGENLNITLSKLESVSDNATAADLLRAVFDGTSDTVFTSASVEIPEGFEKVEIQGTGGTNVIANGLNNFIKGGTGNDTVNGASGVDTFTTQGTFAQSTGVLNQDGSVSLTAKGGGVDRIANIENIQFSDKSVSIAQTIDSAEITYTVVGSSKVVNLLPLNNSSGFLTHPDYKILGRDGQVVLSNNGEFFAQGLSDLIQVTNARTGQITNIPLQGAHPFGNYAPVAVSDDGENVFFVSWNDFNLSNQGYGGLYKYHIDVNNSGEGSSFTRLDTNLSGQVFTYQGWSVDAYQVDVSSDGRYAAFTLRDLVTPNNWDSGQKTNIYVNDTITNQITIIDSGNTNGFSSSPKISDDGRYILFESNAELTQKDIADGVELYWSNDLFVFDLLNNTTTRINEGQDGTRFDTGGYGWSADMSADGKIVTFTAGGTYERQGGTPDGLIDPNGSTADVFVKDLTTGIVNRISGDQNGGIYPHISPNGHFVGYMPYVYSNAIQQEIINLDSGEIYQAPGVPISSYGHFNSEQLLSLSNDSGLLWTWNNYPDDIDGGDADYIYFRYGQTQYSLSTLDGSALPGWVSLDTDGGIPKLIVSDAPSSEFGHHFFVLTAMGSTPVSQTFDLLLKQNTLPTGSVTLSGTATQGQTLTAVNNLADVDGLGAISYTWKANGVTVGSGSSYTLTQQEVGKSITATATYFDGDGTAESVTSASKGSVVNINDLPTGSVLINGVAKEGKNLTATNTIVDADGLGTISYTWKANGTSIGTGTSYTLKQSEVGKSISLSASYVDGFGKSEQIESAATNSVTSINSPDAALYLSDSITDLEQYFVGDPIAQANKLLADKLQQSLEFAFNKTPTNAIGNLVVTSTSVQYTLAPGSVAPAGVKIVINGSGFPSGATTLSALGTDTDYSISSISVIVDSVAGTNFASPVSTVTLNTNINVASSRMTAFGLNGFSIAAGDVNIALTGALSTALGIDASGNVTLKNANFSNAALSITYDTDPSSTATKLAQLYLKGSFGLDSANMSDPLTSATITDFGFKTYAGTNVTASPVHYFYGENLNITLSKLESVSDNATAADLLRAVFDGTSDTVFTSASVEIPEGFEKVEIQGKGGASVTANGLNNFIKGSIGNDTVDGATGSDIFTTQGKFARSTGVLNQDGSVSLTAKGGGVDRITNIENVQFSDKSVYIAQTIDSAEITFSVVGDSAALSIPLLKSPIFNIVAENSRYSIFEYPSVMGPVDLLEISPDRQTIYYLNAIYDPGEMPVGNPQGFTPTSWTYITHAMSKNTITGEMHDLGRFAFNETGEWRPNLFMTGTTIDISDQNLARSNGEFLEVNLNGNWTLVDRLSNSNPNAYSKPSQFSISPNGRLIAYIGVSSEVITDVNQNFIYYEKILKILDLKTNTISVVDTLDETNWTSHPLRGYDPFFISDSSLILEVASIPGGSYNWGLVQVDIPFSEIKYSLSKLDDSPLPSWVSLDTSDDTPRVVVTGAPDSAYGHHFFKLTATGASSVSQTFDLYIQQSSIPTEAVKLIATDLEDQLLGGIGKDILISEGGNDTILSGEGRDYLNGGEGNDYLDGGVGIDLMIGGAGDDIYVVDTLRDVIIDQSGWDTIKSENLTEINLQRYRGIEAAEYIGTGVVTLIGSQSNNSLIGGTGADTLSGKFGNDILTGGDSADSFVFNAKLDAQFNFDQITDFSTGVDKLVLDKTIFARFTNAVQDSNLVMGMDAQDSDDYLIYDSNTQTLYYDADGSAAGAKVAFVQVVGINSLSSADFSVI